jgi:hypothetical protein
MPRYSAPFTKTGADSVRQLVEILSSATVQRVRVTAFVVKNNGTETADVVFGYSLRRVTGSATGTALTPNPVSPQDAACRATAEHLITADHSSFNTAPVELWSSPVNNRATYQMFVPDDQAFEGAAISANGLSLGLAAVSTSTFAGTIGFLE